MAMSSASSGNPPGRSRTTGVVGILAVIALIHLFRVGTYFRGSLFTLYYSYFSDIILPFGMYFLLCLKDDRVALLGDWRVKAMLVCGIASSVVVDRIVLARLLPRWSPKAAALLSGIFLLAATGSIQAQQVPDLNYSPTVPRPAYKSGEGPRVAIDETHFNFHTAEGRYKPFAELLRRDGYRVGGLGDSLSAASLKALDVLVIANALNERNAEDWSLPTPSAFRPDEIAAARAWVEKGGSLFLIADHMPFAGAACELAKAFGVEFSNGYARPGGREPAMADFFEDGNGLKESAVTRGRSDDEKVTKVATFTGSAFKPPKDAIPVLVFGASSVSLETKRAPGITPDAPEVRIEGWCQGALLKVGRGRVAVFGEAAMFSAQLAGPRQIPVGMNSPEARQNYQLLLNAMHWLTRATDEELTLQVREAERAFAKTMAARDYLAFESHIADEAIFFGQQRVLRGKAAVAAGWKPFFEGAKAPFSWEPESVEVLDSGTLAFSTGPVRDPEGREIGTFNSIWRREADGRWMIVFDKGCPPCDCPSTCPPARGVGAISPAISISSMTLVVNGVERTVRGDDTLRASPGDRLIIEVR